MSPQEKTLALLACLALLLLLEPASCGLMRPVGSVEGCKEYNADLTCKACDNGLVLLVSQGKQRCLSAVEEQRGRRLSIIGSTLYQDCLEFNPNGSCKTCVGEKVPWGDFCVFFTQGCAVYNPDGHCSHCYGWKELWQHLCVTPIPGCVHYQTQDECGNCQGGKYLWENQCHTIIQGCVAYEADGSCQNCQGSYTKWQGTCHLTITHCIEYMPDGRCQRCGNNLYINFNRFGCYPAPSSCTSQEIHNFCQLCLTGWLASPENSRICKCEPFGGTCHLP